MLRSNGVRKIGLLSVLSISCFLTACGGGGNSEPAAPPPPSAPSLVVSLPSVSITEPITRQSTVTSAVGFSIQNMPNSVYLRSRVTSGVVTALNVAQTSANSGNLNVTLAAPNEMAPGSYSDTIELSACLESPCVTEIAGSPARISVQYNVVRPTGATAPRMSANATNVNVSAFVIGDRTPQSTPTVAVSNFQGQVFTSLSATANGLSTSPLPWITSGITGGYDIHLYFKSAEQLGVGRYTDTLTVTGCFDRDCVNPIDGSPLTITVDYDVLNTRVDNEGNRIRVIATEVNDMVWHGASQRFYVTQPSRAGANGNSVRTLNPVNGELGAPVFVGSEPSALAVTPDGQGLYVSITGSGSVARYTLPQMTANYSMSFGTGPNGMSLIAAEILVSPSNSNTVAILRDTGQNYGSFGRSVQVFDFATPRPSTIGYGGTTTLPTGLNSLAWSASEADLFGVYTYTTPTKLYRLAVGASGVTLANTVNGFTQRTTDDARAYYDSGRVYVDNGEIYDATNNTAVGSVGSGNVMRIVPDAALGKIFGYTQYDGITFGGQLLKFNAVTLNPQGSYRLPHDPYPNALRGIRRWGPDGLAYFIRDGIDGSYIVLVNGPFVTN